MKFQKALIGALLLIDKRTLNAIPIRLIPTNEACPPIYNTPLSLHTLGPSPNPYNDEALLAHLERETMKPKSHAALHHVPSSNQTPAPKTRATKGAKKQIKEQRRQKWLEKEKSKDLSITSCVELCASAESFKKSSKLHGMNQLLS